MRRIAKKRDQALALFVFLAVVVLGMPLFKGIPQAWASNPRIGVLVTATVEYGRK